MYIVKLITQGKHNLRIDIRQKIKEMKDHFNKEIQFLKNNQAVHIEKM